MSGDSGPMTWREAAEHATFLAYRPVEPVPDTVWLSGFGFSDETTTNHLGISASLRGGEIEVDTALLAQWIRAPRTQQRRQILDAVRHHLHAHEDLVKLPLELRIEPDERTIRVDGVDHVFAGLRVAGSGRWSGGCVVGDLWITVAATSPAVVNAIVASDCSDLGDSPMPRH